MGEWVKGAEEFFVTHSPPHPFTPSPPHLSPSPPTVHICLTLPMPQRRVNSMRSFLAGLIFLMLCSPAFAQISGEVESIGFNSTYRPDCFCPMIVRIKPQAGMSGLYFIEVKQKDLDSDGATFRRPISITGAENS